eukprot:SM000233S07967  [mRNA]  locus=s233:72031:73286:- [translate_table: standard]
MSFLHIWEDGILRFPQAANPYFSQLEMVELFLPDDAGVIIATLASSCLRLREIRVFAAIDHPLDSRLDLEICPAMPALMSLTLGTFNIKMTSFAAFLLKASQVENLSVQRCELVGATRALPSRISLSFPKRGLGFINYRMQQVGDFETEGRPSEVDWQDLAAITRASPQLQEVQLQDCNTMNKKALLDLPSSCPQLAYIRILGSSELSSKQCKFLQRDQLSDIRK